MEWVENIRAKRFGVFLLTKHVTHGVLKNRSVS